uniref:Soluble calcium-activated nucleotidase 1 n=1 Tax=Panagrellus redivivus TaxID=6233 RepID=A0A7E4UM52_PANRE
MAKPKSGTPPAGNDLTPVLIGLLAISFGLLVYYLPYASKCAIPGVPYNTSNLATIKHNADGSTTYRIAVVTDLDKDSKHPTKKNTWQSYYKTGLVTVTPDGKSASVLWQDDHTRVLSSTISAGGRAMELSDLAVFDGKLLTVDDRTGLVYILQHNGNALETIPWVLLNDGPGNITKGLKGEWLTVKDNHLYAGGLGKEWTTTEGVFVNYHPMYVKRVNAAGAVEHIDWVANYKKVRAAVGIDWPGYMIHEAVQWSDVHGKWFFMPRRASTEQYTEATDEFAGTDLLLIADEAFNNVEVHHVGDKGNGARGFSAFAFVPGSNDDLIIALKSEEKDGNPVASYVTLFRVSDGHVLLNEEPLHGEYKFEGVAFI